MKILVTGGCGFIGSNFIRYFLKSYPEDSLINVDKLTYAGNLENLSDLSHFPPLPFQRGDIADALQSGVGQRWGGGHRQLCRRIPCGPFHRRSRRLHEDQCLWDLSSSSRRCERFSPNDRSVSFISPPTRSTGPWVKRELSPRRPLSRPTVLIRRARRRRICSSGPTIAPTDFRLSSHDVPIIMGPISFRKN